MVGKLGCGCCGEQPLTPIFYGPCDCDPPGLIVRGNYSYGWDAPVPSIPLFVFPSQPPHTFDDWIHTSRLHVAAKDKLSVNGILPFPPLVNLWNGYTGYPQADPGNGWNLGLFAPDGPYFSLQFCWNEFDYEISWDARIDSGAKAAFIGYSQGGFQRRKFAQLHCEPLFFSTPSPTSGNGIAIGMFGDVNAPFTSTWGWQGPVTNHKILLYENTSGNLGERFNYPPVILQELDFDTTYTIKVVMKCPPLVYPNHGTMTTQWYLNGALVRQFEIGTELRGEWTQCNDTYWRLKRCTKFHWVQSYLYPLNFYYQNAALSVYTDNFNFKLLRK